MDLDHLFCFTAILNTNIFKQSMRQTNGCVQVPENHTTPHGAYKLEERVHRGKHVVTYLTKVLTLVEHLLILLQQRHCQFQCRFEYHSAEEGSCTVVCSVTAEGNENTSISINSQLSPIMLDSGVFIIQRQPGGVAPFFHRSY